QRPIRILDAIKWDPSFEAELKKSKFKSIPKVGPDYYAGIDIGFDAGKKLDELGDIIKDIDASLGKPDALGDLLKTTTEQYVLVVQMLQARGTKKFWECSKKLYGSAKDKFFEDRNTI